MTPRLLFLVPAGVALLAGLDAGLLLLGFPHLSPQNACPMPMASVT